MALPRSPLMRLLAPSDASPAVAILLWAAALAVAVGAYEHAYLFHHGYRHIDTIGELFVVNAVASAATIMLLALRRPGLFVLATLAVSGGSIIAIILTRTGDGLFGFRESGYDGRATLTLVAEIVSVILVLIAIAMWRARDADGTTVPSSGDGGPAASARSGPSPAAVPSLVAGAVCAVFLLAVTLGIGVGDGEDGQPPVAGVSTTTGDATPSTTDDPATGDDPPVAGEGRSATEDGPTTTDDPVAALGATADTGRDTFTGEGCGGCHRLADAGTGGAIGPDLDRAVADLDADAIRRLIVDPPAGPMPSDYADRIDPERLDALAAYLAAAAGAR